MKKLSLVLASLTLSMSANATLYDRGNGMIYDDVLDITWLQDANYAQTSGYDADGLMPWSQAKTWANQLVYGGFDDWRLPSANLMDPTSPCWAYDGSCDGGYHNTTSELGHMYYNNLGNQAYYSTDGSLLPLVFPMMNFIDGDSGETVSFLNSPPFHDPNYSYWMAEDYEPNPDAAWIFFFSLTYNGEQGAAWKANSYYAWAVRDGDVASTIPVPATFWLFASALLGLVGAYRKNR